MKINGFEVEGLDSFPPEENPFNCDFEHMGEFLGTNVVVMFKNHKYERMNYIIIVNKETGNRIKIRV